jgi:replicative DNA helicase
MYDKGIENTILASMMISDTAYNQALDSLTSLMFYNDENKKIFETLYNEKKYKFIYDSQILAKESDINKDYIDFLLTDTATTPNLKKHIEIFIDNFRKRFLMQSIFKCKAKLEDGESDYISAQMELDKTMSELENTNMIEENISHISQDLGEFYEFMESKNDKYAPTGTGFKKLDDYLGGGLLGGENIVIAGRPGSGKTNLALKLAMNTSKQGKKVLFFSYEMRKRQIVARYLASEGKIDNNNIRQRNLGDKERKRMFNASNIIHDSNIYLCSEYLNVDQLCANVRAFKRQNPDLDMVIIDYLQIIPHSKGFGFDNRLSMTHISKTLAELSKSLDIKLVELSQLTRPSGNRPKKGWPLMTDLKESSQIEQDAHIVLLLYRGWCFNEKQDDGSDYLSDQIEIIIEKNREGRTGVIEVLFEGCYNNIQDYPENYIHVEVVKKESEMTKGIQF